jgi:multiple sugar transport system ATP-binding protein
MTVRVPVDVVESMGSEVYVHFAVGGDRAAAGDLDELAGDAGADELGAPAETEMVARLDAAARPREGETAELWIDTGRIHLFDPADGRCLTR